jgi:hypothetical protein
MVEVMLALAMARKQSGRRGIAPVILNLSTLDVSG